MGTLAPKAGLHTGENPCTWRSPRNALNLVGTFFFSSFSYQSQVLSRIFFFSLFALTLAFSDLFPVTSGIC